MTNIKRMLAGAVALVASSAASAAIVAPGADVANNGAGSELVLTVFDPVAKASYTMDLGLTFGQGLSIAHGTTWNVGPIFNNYLNAVGSLANSSWLVFATDSTQAGSGANLSTYGRRHLSTSVGLGGPLQNLQLQNLGTAVTTYVGQLNNQGTHAGAGNGEAFTPEGIVGYYGSGNLAAIENNTPFPERSAIGAAMDWVLVEQQGTLNTTIFGTTFSPAAFTTAPISLGTFSFDGQVLSFANAAPVPVPAAAWLFGSAISFLGVARRRQAA
ncbi:MAG: hypothetical protein AB7Q81_19175 [Gammaproteobacteria bacterium]